DGLVGENQVSLDSVSSESVKSVARVHICGLARRADVIIGIGHCTGHLLTGYGGALKNIAMGLAGRGGKLDQHSGVLPEIIISECRGCGLCVVHCPARAITLIFSDRHSDPDGKSGEESHSIKNKRFFVSSASADSAQNDKGKGNKKAFINKDICYGCGECFAVCPNEAVKVDKWHAASDMVQSKMARYCAAILKDKKAGFINFATNITKNCDCLGEPEKPLLKDVGVLASLDPVAVDVASIDLINKQVFKSVLPDIDYRIQFKEAERLGVGSTDYEVI
ncbi:MAG: DUF362 domain-containing protein, partial [Planctomycetes bacterium]|nr:DUF362 domain-containing protein [Planctomycetota bacterium]